MAKKQETLTLFPEVLVATRKLTDEQFGVLMRAAFSYRFENIGYSGDDVAVDTALQFVISQIDRYREVCDSKAKAAKDRWEARKTEGEARNTDGCRSMQKVQTDAPILSSPILSNPIPSNNKDIKANESPKTVVGDVDFDQFWKAYPKKVGKKEARKAFAKIKVATDILLGAIEKQKQSKQWQKDNGQYIPNPSTWLNQSRWEDELETNTLTSSVGVKYNLSEEI